MTQFLLHQRIQSFIVNIYHNIKIIGETATRDVTFLGTALKMNILHDFTLKKMIERESIILAQ